MRHKQCSYIPGNNIQTFMPAPVPLPATSNIKRGKTVSRHYRSSENKSLPHYIVAALNRLGSYSKVQIITNLVLTVDITTSHATSIADLRTFNPPSTSDHPASPVQQSHHQYHYTISRHLERILPLISSIANPAWLIARSERLCVRDNELNVQWCESRLVKRSRFELSGCKCMERLRRDK